MITMTLFERTERPRGYIYFRDGHRIAREDVQRVIELVCDVRLRRGCTMMDCRLLRFLIDDVAVINPLGLECRRLEALAEVTTGGEL